MFHKFAESNVRYVGSVMQLADAGRGVVQLRLRRDMGKTLCVVWTILQLLVWLVQFDAWTKNCQTRIARSVSNIPCKMQKVDTSQQFNCNMYSMLMHIPMCYYGRDGVETACIYSTLFGWNHVVTPWFTL